MKDLNEMTSQELGAFEAHLRDYALDLQWELEKVQNTLDDIKKVKKGDVIENKDANT